MWIDQLHFANGAQGAALLALPLLAMALIAELVASTWLRRDGHYDRRDTLTSFALYVGNALTARLWGPLALFMYGVGHQHRWFDLPLDLRRASRCRCWTWTWTWAALFLLDDFCYYWSHRAAHRLPVLWASHVVHHSPAGVST